MAFIDPRVNGDGLCDFWTGFTCDKLLMRDQQYSILLKYLSPTEAAEVGSWNNM